MSKRSKAERRRDRQQKHPRAPRRNHQLTDADRQTLAAAAEVDPGLIDLTIDLGLVDPRRLKPGGGS